MEWWEYLIVFVVWMSLMGIIGVISWDGVQIDEEVDFKIRSVWLTASVCLLLLLLITYKLFLT